MQFPSIYLKVAKLQNFHDEFASKTATGQICLRYKIKKMRGKELSSNTKMHYNL